MAEQPIENVYDRRNHQRFKVKPGSIFMLKPESLKLGQVTDISMGGLALHYSDTSVDLNEPFRLTLEIPGCSNFSVINVKVTPISDSEITIRMDFGDTTMKRCSLQFEGLTHKQKARINEFIQSSTLH